MTQLLIEAGKSFVEGRGGHLLPPPFDFLKLFLMNFFKFMQNKMNIAPPPDFENLQIF